MLNKNLLVIEDDSGIRELLYDLLTDYGYRVTMADRGTIGLKIISQNNPDLVVLDLGLPDISGESVCKEIRRKYPRTRVIVLSAKHNLSDIVNSLNLGADDYITKPFMTDEFLARVNARLRHNSGEVNKLRAADLTIDTSTHEVIRADCKIDLSPKEFLLLMYMVQNKNRILTRSMILDRVWSGSHEVETRVVDVYLGYLRKKIDKNYSTKLIKSIRGFGYMIQE